MDSAVVKVSSIGVLLPSISLSNVVDVNDEHDDSMTKDILCDIKGASTVAAASTAAAAAAVRVSSLERRHSSYSVCSSSTLEKPKKLNWRRGSLSSRIFPCFGCRKKLERRRPNVDAAEVAELRSAPSQPTASSKQIAWVEGFTRKLKLLGTNATKTQEMINQLYEALETDKTGRSGEWKNLVHSEFVSKLENYPEELDSYKRSLLQLVSDKELWASVLEEQCLMNMVCDLIHKEWDGLMADVKNLLDKKLSNLNYQISKSLKTGITRGIEKNEILFPVLRDCIDRFKGKLASLVRGGRDQVTKGEDRIMQQKQQQQFPETLTFDQIQIYCRSQLLYITDKELYDHALEIIKLCPINIDDDDKLLFDFEDWLNTYNRLRLTLRVRWSTADIILAELNEMQQQQDDVDKRNSKRELKLTSKCCFDQNEIEALKLRCEKAKRDMVDTVKQIRGGGTSNSQIHMEIENNEMAMDLLSGPEPPVQKDDVMRITRIIRNLHSSLERPPIDKCRL